MSNSMSEKDHDVSLRGTEFDSHTPGIYSTIPEAQKEHTRYNASQVRNVEGSVTGSIASTELKYGYDDIVGEGSMRGGCASVKEEGGSGGGVVRGGSQRMETRNAMYEDNKIEGGYHHPSLAVGSRQVYSGPVADDYREPKDSYVTCRCKTKDLVVAFFIIVAVLLAVASLALSLLLWFGIYDGSSDCTCPGNPPPPPPSLSSSSLFFSSSSFTFLHVLVYSVKLCQHSAVSLCEANMSQHSQYGSKQGLVDMLWSWLGLTVMTGM